jgi:vitamin B12/bleomycin/antimicrobial peptide transport system ATP-binding/permease protein
MSWNQKRAWVLTVQMIRLFFSSAARWPAISRFALLLTLLLAFSGLNVVNSYVGRDLMTAIAEKRWDGFITYGLVYLVVFALLTIVATFSRFSEERLRLQFRAWLTQFLVDLYMSRDRLYRLKASEKVVSPDARITEDVKAYTQALLFFLMTFNASITSLAFLGVLWSITPWIVLVALIYASAGSAITILLGCPLVRLDNLQLKKEVDLRYQLILSRDMAEAITTLGEARTVRECLRDQLADVVSNNKRIIAVTRDLGLFTNGYNYLTQLIPLAIVAPMYMQGRVEFGVVTQAAMAFATFMNGFSLIIAQVETLSSFTAVTNRLDTIALALDQAGAQASSPIQVSHDDNRVAYERLSLWLRHDRRPLIDDLTLEVVYGSSLLVTGPDTAAGEALMMATAGFWDQGSGRIIRPGPEGIYFAPTLPLTVRRSLRSQLIADSPERRFFSDLDILAMLDKVGLAAAVRRVGGLDAEVHSPSDLSPVEQRLLLFARVLLACPRFVFLDRVGAVPDQEQDENVYRLLREVGISYLSIGDRHRLEAYHDRVLDICGEGRWEVTPAGEPHGDDGPADARLWQ